MKIANKSLFTINETFLIYIDIVQLTWMIISGKEAKCSRNPHTGRAKKIRMPFLQLGHQ